MMITTDIRHYELWDALVAASFLCIPHGPI
jgi:hypothetical protein